MTTIIVKLHMKILNNKIYKYLYICKMQNLNLKQKKFKKSSKKKKKRFKIICKKIKKNSKIDMYFIANSLKIKKFIFIILEEL